MVVILYQDKHKDLAEAIRNDLIAAFKEHIQIDLLSADVDSSWPAESSWDDLLIVVYGEEEFPEPGNQFIAQSQQRPQPAMLLPVALAADPAFRKPPKAASAIKALPYDDTAKGANGKLANRAGAMLGLRVQGRESKIFISYRATDGKDIANQLYKYLKDLGHDPYLDEAQEEDGFTKILPGTPVQDQIRQSLKTSNLLLLVDTADVLGSSWIKLELDTADASILPILPIVFRDDNKQGPRFRSLRELQRWVQLSTPAPGVDPLSDEQLEEIQSEMELYMCDIFRRKLRVPYIVQKEFSSNGFDWQEANKQLLMFRSSKPPSGRIRTTVLSHCSLFDSVYTPAMTTFVAFIKAETNQSNYNLFIYDGDLLTEAELQGIINAQGGSNVTILHHQELATLLKLTLRVP